MPIIAALPAWITDSYDGMVTDVSNLLATVGANLLAIAITIAVLKVTIRKIKDAGAAT